MFLRKVAACCVLATCSLTALAQMGASTEAQAPEPGSIATPAAAFDSQLTLIEKSMMGAVKAMPADKFSFAPSQPIFAPGQKTEFAKVPLLDREPRIVDHPSSSDRSVTTTDAPCSRNCSKKD